MANKNPKTDHLSSFTTDREESCTAQISVRIPPSLKSQLKNKQGWQEAVRVFLAEYAELENA